MNGARAKPGPKCAHYRKKTMKYLRQSTQELLEL